MNGAKPFDWRHTPGLSAYTALIFVFFYAPLLILVIYAFNSSRLVTVWAGFSFKWFVAVANNEAIRDAAFNSVIIAVVATIASTAIATAGALALERGRLRFGRGAATALIAMLPPTIAALAEFLQDFTKGYEVLIVVEGSGDGTLEIAAELAAQQAHFRVIDNGPQRGKGHAVRSGMLQGQGEIVFFMDADLSVPLADVTAFLRHFEENPGVDVLVGNRQHARSRINRRQSPLRETMGKVFNRILQSFSLVALRDTQCGFKAFRQKASRQIFSRQTIDGFAFDVEVLLLADRLGFRVEDLPVEWNNSTESKVSIVADSWQMLCDAWKIRTLVEKNLSVGDHPRVTDTNRKLQTLE